MRVGYFFLSVTLMACASDEADTETPVGAALKLADPVLLVAVAASYGPRRFGLFYVAHAVVLLLLRVSLVGLDKAEVGVEAYPEFGRS